MRGRPSCHRLDLTVFWKSRQKISINTEKLYQDRKSLLSPKTEKYHYYCYYYCYYYYYYYYFYYYYYYYYYYSGSSGDSGGRSTRKPQVSIKSQTGVMAKKLKT